MKDIKTLILAGSGYNLSIAPEAETLKTELLKHSGMIVEVRDQDAAAATSIQLGKLADMRILVEKSRKKVKEPVLKVGKDIDGKAQEFVQAIEAEEKRLAKLIGDFAELVAQERARIMREIEAKKQEDDRKAREAEEARLKAEWDAEAARKKAELDAMAAEAAMFAAQSPEEEAAAAKRAEEARKAEEARVAAEVARKAEADRVAAEKAREAPAQAVLVPQKVEGAKFVPDYELTDIHALYRHRPSLVTLSERRAEILDHIKANTHGDTLPEIPGLRVFIKAVVSGR